METEILVYRQGGIGFKWRKSDSICTVSFHRLSLSLSSISDFISVPVISSPSVIDILPLPSLSIRPSIFDGRMNTANEWTASGKSNIETERERNTDKHKKVQRRATRWKIDADIVKRVLNLASCN